MHTKTVLLVGNPNVGKSTIFNALCNTKQKTGNYAGVTVSSLSGEYSFAGEKVLVTDLPGVYSAYPSSEDEAISIKRILNFEDKYAGVLFVLEVLNIKRGLLLFQQMQDLGIPMLLLVNQIDEAKKRGVVIDFEKLEAELGTKIIQTNAKNGEGISELKEAIHQDFFSKKSEQNFDIPVEFRHQISPNYSSWYSFVEENKSSSRRMQVKETIRRYQHIDKMLEGIVSKKANTKELLTEKLDKILVHKVWGYLIFGLILLIIFQSVFFFAEYPMGWIETLISGDEESGFLGIKGWIGKFFPEGPLKSLITEGIIPGIESVVVFAPQIGILLYFLYLLEDSGYMARAVFLMDRFLRPFGLNGKSILPLVSSTACAIPAVMGARNIENFKERLLTILVTPFVACSARLPIYSIIIALIIPDEYFLGFLSYKALVLLMMYLLGFVVALLSSLILKKLIKSKEKSFLIMDLPTYKMPQFIYNFKLVLGKIWEFISGAGKIIFVISIILWGLAYFGPSKNNSEWVAKEVQLNDSYLAMIGRGIEPIVEPMGYDWKMGVGVLTSFAARETFVSTISTLYGLDVDVESEEGEMTLMERMKADTKPNGEKLFSFATGMSILMFYAFAMQCISTIAIVYRETKSMKWTVVQLVGMTTFAYLTAILVYQIFR